MKDSFSSSKEAGNIAVFAIQKYIDYTNAAAGFPGGQSIGGDVFTFLSLKLKEIEAAFDPEDKPKARAIAIDAVRVVVETDEWSGLGGEHNLFAEQVWPLISEKLDAAQLDLSAPEPSTF